MNLSPRDPNQHLPDHQAVRRGSLLARKAKEALRAFSRKLDAWKLHGSAFGDTAHPEILCSHSQAFNLASIVHAHPVIISRDQKRTAAQAPQAPQVSDIKKL